MGAEVEFLYQPTAQELIDKLWEKNWQILLYSGHSESEDDGSRGYISLNGEKLPIDRLRESLKESVKMGLQLAIFNSCNGLGIAKQLEELNLLQMIVMREIVPNIVAQEFLKDFLRAFAGGNGERSLHDAVREARKKLKDKWEECYPGISWLPIICQQQPDIKLLAWNELLPSRSNILEFPNGSVPLNSVFYIERHRYIEGDSIESMCYHEITKPGSLIRIKAPKEMGKTSLLDRIIAYADKQQYQRVRVNFAEVEEAKFSSMKKFLSWLCYCVSVQLQISEQLNHPIKEVFIDTPTDCKIYFQEHFLKPINSPIVLALDEVDRIFNYTQVSNEFFKMLRVWHEESNNKPIWRNLRLVVVHSTEDYGPLNINESPFNVGKPVELSEFTPEQVLDLARRHKLNWNNDLVKTLMAMVGGHPYLVRLAFYHLTQPGGNLELFLQNAPTNDGIYRNHLFRHLNILEKNKELGIAFKQVVSVTKAVELGRQQRYKLYSMGLTNRLDNPLMPRCELYRMYFREQMGIKTKKFWFF